MGFKKIIGDKKILLTDFTPEELTLLESYGVSLYNTLLNYEQISLDHYFVTASPRDWDVYKAQFWTVTQNTLGLNHAAFNKIQGANRLLSVAPLRKPNNYSWDLDPPKENLFTVTARRFIRDIFDIIQPKYQDSLDIDEFYKQLKIKQDIELIHAELTDVIYKLNLQIQLDKVAGFGTSGAKSIIGISTATLSLAFPPAAPIIQIVGAITSILSTMSDPDPKYVVREKFEYYTEITKRISELKIQLFDYVSRINLDGYDYNFSEGLISVYTKKGKGEQTPATFTVKPNQDGTITVQSIEVGDVVIIDGKTGVEAKTIPFVSSVLSDGLHKVSVTGTNNLSYAETVNVTTKVSVFSNPLGFVNNNKVVVFSLIFLLILIYILWKKGYFVKRLKP